MDPRIAKFRERGLAPDLAEALVGAGIETPRKIKAARVSDLRKAKSTADKDARIRRWRRIDKKKSKS